MTRGGICATFHLLEVDTLAGEERRSATVNIRRSLGPPPPAIKIGEVAAIHADCAGEVVGK